MSLKHTILGFLSYGPHTGYDLKKRMDNSTQSFWNAHLAQIYPTLKRLEVEGLAESFVEAQTGKPDKKYYLITDAGRAELDAWLREPPNPTPQIKNAALLKLFFSGALPKPVIIQQLERQLEIHRARLHMYETYAKAALEKQSAQSGQTRESVMWDLVRQFGVEHTKTYIRWLEHAIETVNEQITE